MTRKEEWQGDDVPDAWEPGSLPCERSKSRAPLAAQSIKPSGDCPSASMSGYNLHLYQGRKECEPSIGRNYPVYRRSLQGRKDGLEREMRAESGVLHNCFAQKINAPCPPFIGGAPPGSRKMPKL